MAFSLVDRLETLSKRLNSACEVFVAILIAAIVVDVVAQVVFRYVLNSSLSWSEELARYIFVWIIFLGTSVAARRKRHIAMQAIACLFPTSMQPWLAAVNLIICIVFFVLFTYFTALLVQNANYELSSALQIPISWVYAAAPIGAVLTIVHLVNALVRVATHRHMTIG